jgi:hypothetical protein
MTPAPHSPLVVAVGNAIRETMTNGKLQPETAAQVALGACRFEELLGTLREYIAAADASVAGDNDIAAMLRFGNADRAARALVAKLDGKP